MTSTGVKKFKNMSPAGKIMPAILWDKEGLILWGCYLCGRHWTLTAVVKHEEVWTFAFVHWLLPYRNMPEVLLSHENSRPPTNAHTPEAFTKFVWTYVRFLQPLQRQEKKLCVMRIWQGREWNRSKSLRFKPVNCGGVMATASSGEMYGPSYNPRKMHCQ